MKTIQADLVFVISDRSQGVGGFAISPTHIKGQLKLFM